MALELDDQIKLHNDFGNMCKRLGGKIERLTDKHKGFTRDTQLTRCTIGPVKMDLRERDGINLLFVESETVAEELEHSVAGIQKIVCGDGKKEGDSCNIIVKGHRDLMLVGLNAWRNIDDLILDFRSPDIGTEATYNVEPDEQE